MHMSHPATACVCALEKEQVRVRPVLGHGALPTGNPALRVVVVPVRLAGEELHEPLDVEPEVGVATCANAQFVGGQRGMVRGAGGLQSRIYGQFSRTWVVGELEPALQDEASWKRDSRSDEGCKEAVQGDLRIGKLRERRVDTGSRGD